ncbi:hypothetical protein EMGBS10_05420 [Opitutia bacterium]|jgi:hypothetical protein|nr:hypothetical protein EMGBS10_05420 [Opitutae bacterium]
MRLLLTLGCLTLVATAAPAGKAVQAEKEERGPKSPEAKVRVTGKGHIIEYKEGETIVIRTEGAKGEPRKLRLAIPRTATWPHLGSVFFEVIFDPPAHIEGNFPVHSPMRPESVAEGMEVWYALEGPNADNLQLYQVACRVDAESAARFNAVVRNAVKLRESREQPEIARDYQCRLIEAPKGSGNYPDDPALLAKYVKANAIYPDRLDVKAPPSGRNGYGKGLKSSDVYANGVGAPERRKEGK